MKLKKRTWVILVLVFALVFLVTPRLFVFNIQQVESPSSDYVAILYSSADESHLVPYGVWVEIRPWYKSWLNPDSYNSVFAGYCEVTASGNIVDWVDDETLSIKCSHGNCSPRRRLSNFGEISIVYDISDSGKECAN